MSHAATIEGTLAKGWTGAQVGLLEADKQADPSLGDGVTPITEPGTEPLCSSHRAFIEFVRTAPNRSKPLCFVSDNRQVSTGNQPANTE